MTQNIATQVTLLENYDRPLETWEVNAQNYVRNGTQGRVLEHLLGKVGEDGDNPTITSYLFKLALDSPQQTAYELYPDPMNAVYDRSEEPLDVYPKLFAVFEQRLVRPQSEPVGLVLVEASDFTIYKGFRTARIISWFNHSITTQGHEAENLIRQRAYKQIFTDIDNRFGVCVRPEVAIYDMALPDAQKPRSLGNIGVSPDDHLSGAESRQMSRLARIDYEKFGDHSQLIRVLSDVFSRLDPDVIDIDMEGGEHYNFALRGASNAELGDVDGITINIEDRPGGAMYRYDEERNYSNPWGDMVVVLTLNKETVQTMYSLTVFMDKGYGMSTSYLDKRTVPRRKDDSVLQHLVGNLIDFREDELDTATNVNHIDEVELASLCQLIEVAS